MDYAELVLAGILPNRRDHLVLAVTQLQVEHFTNDTHSRLFALLRRYYDRTGEVMPTKIFEDALQQKLEPAKALAYLETFKALVNKEVSNDEFSWSVGALRDAYAQRQTGQVIATGMEILERGVQIGKETLKGDEDARRYLTSQIHHIERLGNAESAPEGNIFSPDETERLLTDYAQRKAGIIGKGVPTGIYNVDAAVGGMQRGEFVTVCAFQGQGKSQTVTQMAWNAAVNHKKNVLFATTETVRDQVIRRVLARHSRLSKFGMPDGINSSDIKKGTLSLEGEKVYKEVLEDWVEGKKSGEYGVFNILQVPRGAKLSYVEMRLKEFGREYGCDLVVVDYLPLFKSEIRRGNEREEFNELLRDAKLMAVGYNDGEGVPVASPWQMSRDAYEKANQVGFYVPASLSDTSEAEKSSDLIIALKRDEENHREMLVQVLKARDDELPPMETVAIDFRSSFIGHRNVSSFVQTVAPTTVSIEDMLSAVG